MRLTKTLLISAVLLMSATGMQAAGFNQNGNYLTVQLKQHQNFGPSQIRLQVPNPPPQSRRGWGRGPFFIIKVLCKHSIQAVLKKNEWLCNEYYGQNAFMTKINDYFGNSKKNCIEIP